MNVLITWYDSSEQTSAILTSYDFLYFHPSTFENMDYLLLANSAINNNYKIRIKQL